MVQRSSRPRRSMSSISTTASAGRLQPAQAEDPAHPPSQTRLRFHLYRCGCSVAMPTSAGQNIWWRPNRDSTSTGARFRNDQPSPRPEPIDPRGIQPALKFMTLRSNATVRSRKEELIDGVRWLLSTQSDIHPCGYCIHCAELAVVRHRRMTKR